MLFLQIFLVSPKVVVMRFSYTGPGCISSIIEIHPIMIEDTLSKSGKRAFTLCKFINICHASYISCIATSRPVTGNFPFRLYKENKMFYNRFYSIQLQDDIYIHHTDSLYSFLFYDYENIPSKNQASARSPFCRPDSSST